MTNYHPVFSPTLRATVNLPASKSISARALIIGALAGDAQLSNLSDCDDTRVLRKALGERLPNIDIMAAGTAMRFSTAYFATCEGETHVLTGTDRMKNRPISILVDALRKLGAEISYVEKEGFPPLRVNGRRLKGGYVELPANVSSQYISALLMIGPILHEGLHLRLVGEILSRPYIDMTLELMKKFGAQAEWVTEQDLRVHAVPYVSGLHFVVEPDWSAASYWYEMVALSHDASAQVVLPALSENSCQGDSVVEQLFSLLGVETIYEAGRAILKKSSVSSKNSEIVWNLDACPDLAQTLVVTCALLGQPFRFSGLQSLRIKETDRIAALQRELKKIGVDIESFSEVTAGKETEIMQMLHPQFQPSNIETEFETYDDHRMAMAFAPVALLCPHISIAHPEVVSKSYPGFWEDLEKLRDEDLC